MKTVVLGLFDELDDARRVLSQLASSPLDLAGVEIVRRDLASQMALAADAGIRSRREPWAAVAAGALLGATAGVLLGQGPLASLGPLLALAAGLVVGGLGGAALAGFSDTLRVPPEHAEAVLAAVESGATAVVVRTDNLPTARAIGDLFKACGSRALAPDDEPAEASASAVTAAAPVDPSGSVASPPSARPTAGAETLFAPPWRRGVPQTDVEPSPPPTGSPAVPPVVSSSTGEARPRPEPVAGPGESAPVRFDPRPMPPPPPPPTGEPVDAAAPRAEPDRAPAPPSGDAAARAEPAPAPATRPTAAEPEPEGVALAEDADIILLGLTARHARALRDAGIATVGAAAAALARLEEGDLAVAGIGPAGLRALREQLGAAGLALPPAPAAAAETAPAAASTEGADVRALLHAAIRDIRSERE